jgi:microsomal dipeptidase-like Zn-dependent dipeptidase
MTQLDANQQAKSNYVKELANAIQRRKDVTSFMNDVRTTAKDLHGFEAKELNKLAKLLIEQNAQAVRDDVNQLVDTYEALGLGSTFA